MHDLLWGSAPRFHRTDPHYPPTFDTLIVSRRVSAGPDRTAAIVGDPGLLSTTLPDGSAFEVGSMMARPGIVGTRWSGDGLIRRRGVVRRPLRLAIEIAAWSDESGEVRISPATRHVPNWGPRRFVRYFELAHDAADHLRRLLHETDAAREMAQQLPLERAA
jgi:hypothetical protein